MLIWIYLLFTAAVFAAKLQDIGGVWVSFSIYKLGKVTYKTPNHGSELTVYFFFPTH